MKFKRYQPSFRLRPFVKAFMIIESKNEIESRILPDTSVTLAFRIKGKVSQDGGVVPPAAISGLRNQLRVLNYSKHTSTLVVAFQEGGANAFFSEPLHELFGRSLPLDDLLQRSKIAETEEKLSEAEDNLEKIKTVESFLLSQIRENRKDLLIFKAVSQIKDFHGDVKIKELLKFLHTSRDPFEKRFRHIIGTSPKQFSQIIRLRNVINHHSPEKNFTELALEAGYFDQAHFIKDFKAFTGFTPRKFLNASVW